MRLFLGLLFWLGLLVLGTVAAARVPLEQKRALEHTQAELWRSWFAPSPAYEVVFRRGTRVAAGNGVFVLGAQGLARVGEVTAFQEDAAGTRARILLDTARWEQGLPGGTRVVWRSEGDSLVYCVQTLLPRERREEIQGMWQEFWLQSQERVLSQIRPLVPGLIRETLAFLGQELDRTLEAHDPEVQELTARLRALLAERNLIAILSQDVWPLVRSHAAGPAEVIGRQLWERAPLFDLAWRAAYDRVLADRPVKLEERWNAFVREEAVPLLRDHEELIRATLEAILRDVAASPEVRSQVKGLAADVLQDPQVRELIGTILRDLLVSNPRLEEFLAQKGEDPEIRARLQRVNDEFQTFFNRVGNLLVYAGDGVTINPDLAHLLRLFLLRHDQQYLFLELGEGPPLPPGEELVGTRE